MGLPPIHSLRPETQKSTCLLSFPHSSPTLNSMCVCNSKCVQAYSTPWPAARQAPLSVEFSRQEYWSGLSFPPPGDLPHPGIKPASPALAVGFFTPEPPQKSLNSIGLPRKFIRVFSIQCFEIPVSCLLLPSNSTPLPGKVSNTSHLITNFWPLAQL